jgi:diguanylate cyclase (GGDEF)-like protein/PAS domain S-box-containing protein
MRSPRIDTLQWFVGAFCLAVGALMLVAPHEFGAAAYAALRPMLGVAGLAYLLGGGALVAVAALRPGRWPTTAAHLVAAGLLLGLSASCFAGQSGLGALSYGLMGLGTAYAAVVARSERADRSPDSPDLFTVVIGASAVVGGTVLIAHPEPWQSTASRLGASGLAYLQGYGLLLLASGAALAWAQVTRRAPRSAARAAALACALLLLVWVGGVSLPGHGWLNILYFGGVTGLLILQPWLRRTLYRLDTASLRARLALVLAVAVAAPLIASVTLSSEDEQRTAEANALATQETVAAALADHVAEYVGLHAAAVNTLATQPGLLALPADTLAAQLRAVNRSYPDVRVLSVYDAAGRGVARSDDLPVVSAAPQSMYADVRAAGRPAIRTRESPVFHRPIFGFGAPLTGQDGAFAGVVVGVVDSARLAQGLTQISMGDGGRAYLVDATGHAIAHPDPALVANLADLSANAPVAALLAADDGHGQLAYETPGGQRLAGYARVSGLGWGVVAEQPAASALAGTYARRELAVVLLLLAMGLAAVGGVVVAIWLAAPLRAFAAAADRLAAGDDAAPLPTSRISEIARLAAGFAEMRDRLARRTAEREAAEAEVRALNAELEQRVAERTQALQLANEQLHGELVERQLMSEALRRSDERYRALIGNASDVITIVDAAGYICTESPSSAQHLGYPPGSLIRALAFGLVHPEDLPAAHDLLAQSLEQPRAPITTELRLRHQDGTYRDFEVVANNLLENPAVGGIVITCHNITERKAFERQLQRLAFHDQLTGLPNRALFLDRLDHALVRAARRADTVGILFLDLDNFKLINDSLGHEAGDRMLVEVARRLKTGLRGGDTAARLGGDEFTILLDGVVDEADAEAIAARVLAALRDPILLEGHEIFPSCSVGIALSMQAADTPESLLRNADLAMYRAKANGKARAELFDPGMNSSAMERLELEADLRRAVDNREGLVVHFQPIISLETARMTDMEALVRWAHPKRGLVSPTEFIPVAEETGLIVPLGHYVLEEACRRVRDWQERYPDAAPQVVSVNLSTRQFQSPTLVADITRTLAETGLPASRLKLEITESSLAHDMDHAIRTLDELKALGIQLSIDDFGTGYSSLNYIKRLPIDCLKIDKSFVDGLGQDAHDTAIVRSVIELARSLDLEITGEGIETETQLERLRELGCQLGQGYYFFRPAAPDKVDELLAHYPAITLPPRQAASPAA